jgi:hypothetical protein
MSKKDHKTAMAVFVDGKWLIGLPTPARTQPQPVRLPFAGTRAAQNQAARHRPGALSAAHDVRTAGRREMVRRVGLEPTTLGLKVRCSTN